MRTRCSSFVLALLLTTAATSLAQLPGVRDRAKGPYNVGLENMRAEAWEEAVKSFRTAIDIDPAFEMAYYMLGRTHMAQKKYVDAASSYEKCRDLYRAQVGRQYTNAQERQLSHDTSLREIDEVIRSYQSGPPTPQMLDAIHQLERRRREIEEAMSRGNSTMTIEMSVPAYVSTALGSAYFRSGRLQDAEKEYKAATAADPRAGEAYSNLAVVYLETGRYVEADRAVKAAEKAGFRVNPMLKEEIAAKKKG